MTDNVPPSQPTPPMQPATPAGEIPSEAKTFAMLAHLLGLLAGFIGPLVIWLIGKDKHPFVNEQGKEALNWQITVGIAGVACLVLAFIPFVQCLVFVVGPAVGIANIVFCILAAVKASSGEAYRYPVALRLVN